MDGSHDAAERRASADDVILRLASARHGVVTRAQLVRAGVSGDRVDRRLKAGRLEPMHRGVYRVGPIRAPRAREMAAVFACGESGVVSHRSAAVLWLLSARPGSGRVEISTSRGDHARRPGIHVHRTRTLLADEVTKLDGIPITTVARTLYDLAGVAPRHHVERALVKAVSRGLTSRAALDSLLARHRRHPGASRFRALLERDVPLAATRSEAEDLFLALVRKAQLPTPAVNTTVCGYEVDFVWRAERFAVEIDGYAHHSSAAMFDGDRRRDSVLAAAGVHGTRVTWEQLVKEPEAVLVRLAQALACRRVH